MSHEKILLLEDHAETREQTTQVLVEADYAVQAVATGAAAVELARREPFDLLIADVYLPGLSGIQVFQQIRTIRPDIAGIVITFYSSWELASDALRAGFVSFLVKPVVPEQLLAAIVSALEQEKLRRENARLRALVPLYELSRALMGTLELNDLLHQVVTMVQQETKAEVVSLMLLDENQRELRIAAAAGLPTDVIDTQRRALGNGIAGWVARRGEPVMVAEGIPLDPEIRDAMDKPEVLSALSLPLRSRGKVIGVLNLSRLRGSDPFTSADMELATVFTSQAAIAIDKARLLNQVKRLSDISQRIARAGDLDDVVNTILKAPVELMGAHGSALWLTDGASSAPTLKTFGLDNVPAPALPRKGMVEEFRPDGDAGWLTVPLRRAQKTLGALSVRMTSPDAPSEDQFEMLRTLAHSAAAVIESHRLRARELVAFREMDRAVRADIGLKDLLERLLAEMIAVCEADGGTIFLWDPERVQIEPWITQGSAVQPSDASEIIKEGRVCVITGPGTTQSIVGVPMTTGARIEGVAALVRSSNTPFRTEQIDLLSTLASAAALAVRNAQLYARSEEAAITEERTRIAREIHDGLAQDLSYLVLKISAAQKLLSQNKERELQKELRDISDQLRRDMRDVRRIIFALRPLDIEAQGFQPALKKFVKEFGQANEIDLQLNVQGDTTHLSPKLETALFRLTQEALNNIRKHAHAKRVWINLTLEDNHMATLAVRDDGRGFEVEQELQAARIRGSVGLMQMRERAERAGGAFSVESALGKGTQIQVQLPIREF